MFSLIHFIIRLSSQLLTKNKLSILIYHQVLSEPDPMRATEPTTDIFRWQMKLINRYFVPISLSEAVVRLANDTLPANAICVTFDDGYLDNLENAAPILKEFDIPATVYVATAFSHGKNMFNDRVIDLIGNQNHQKFHLEIIGLGEVKVTDVASRNLLVKKIISKVKYQPYKQRQAVIDELYRLNNADESPGKMMIPEQIKALSDLGIEIGAHTVDHPILKVLPEQEQFKQLVNSKQTLEKWLNKSVSNFAYPNGRLHEDYSEKTVELVKSAGFNSAVSTHHGISDKETDIYQLKRFTPWDKTPLRFHIRLLLNALSRVN